MKRRKNKKTDYKQRLALLKSGKTRLVVRMSLNNIRIQFVKYEKGGDTTLAEEISKNLKKYGWLGHANLPAAYLTGLLAGLMALKVGIKSAVLDIGLQTSVKSSSLYAAAKGVLDAGVNVNANESVFPSEERISGKHIEEYAKKLRADSKSYEKQFSSYLKLELKPEKISEHFEEVKKKIMKEFGVKDA